MGAKPKTRKTAKPTNKAKKKAAEKPQRERFIEAARAHGVDETGKEFEALFGKVVPQKSRQSTR